MAIRFLCSSCRQPVEVDDTWASRAAVCPFCRTTITAPSTSTLTDLNQIPEASPLRSPGNETRSPSYTESHRQPGNALGVVSLALAFIAFFSMFAAALVLAPHDLEMKSMIEEMQRASHNGSKTQVQAMMEIINARGGVFPGWLMAAGLISAFGMLAWLAAVVCGLIALTRKSKRGLAAASLIVCAIMAFIALLGQ